MDAKKVVPLVAIAAGVVFLRRLGSRARASVDWGQFIERMPDDAPPKWMFRNVTALREEHERILAQNRQILEQLQQLTALDGRSTGKPGTT
jgi:hypothetical protein